MDTVLVQLSTIWNENEPTMQVSLISFGTDWMITFYFTFLTILKHRYLRKVCTLNQNKPTSIFATYWMTIFCVTLFLQIILTQRNLQKESTFNQNSRYVIENWGFSFLHKLKVHKKIFKMSGHTYHCDFWFRNKWRLDMG